MRGARGAGARLEDPLGRGSRNGTLEVSDRQNARAAVSEKPMRAEDFTEPRTAASSARGLFE